jgi:uncharacterized Zn finger protein
VTTALGFPAFPARKPRPGRFARSWWGQAWLRALEDTSLDAEPLKRGRRFAFAGRVGPITVSPGHLAALLDRDMPHELVTAAADADVPLLPGIGDLQPECDCPGYALPCVHAAALCFQAAWLLDADPFVLLLLRGRGQREVLDAIRRRSTANQAVSTPPAPDGPPAPRDVPADPPPPLEVPPAPGVDPEALAAAAARAAGRARDLLLRDRSGAESKVAAELGRLLREGDRHGS